MSAALVYMCNVCSVSVLGVRSYVSHIRLCHHKTIDLNLSCTIGGCTSVFNTSGAFCSHVYRQHREHLNLPEPTSSCLSSTNNVNSTPDVFEEDDMDVSDHLACQPLETEPVPYEVSVPEYSKTESAKFPLKLSQQHHLSQSAISDVINGSQSHCMAMANYVTSLIADRMATNGISKEVISEVCSVQGLLPQPFDGLETNYLQEKFY